MAKSQWAQAPEGNAQRDQLPKGKDMLFENKTLF